MEYRNNTTGDIETQQQIIEKNPNTSFPKPCPDSVIEDLGYSTISEGVTPSFTPPYESVSKNGYEEISGKWYTKYEKTTATGDAKTAIDNNEANRQRGDRNSKLAETDYLALSDATLTDEMKTYRQALRDLPTTSGWPWNPTWPTKPS